MAEINKSNPFAYNFTEQRELLTIPVQRDATWTEPATEGFIGTQLESFLGKEAPTPQIKSVCGINPPEEGGGNTPKPKTDVDAETAEDIQNIENPGETSVGIKSTEALNALDANTYYKDIVIDGENVSVDKDITLKANEEVYLDGVTVTGEKGTLNGKVTFASKEMTLSNITIENGSTVYNAFEGYQKTNDPNYTGVEKVNVVDMTVDNPSLKHNVVNVYTPANNAVINVKNSTFNMTVDNSNVLRLANYMNAENVTVNFENVEWTYENGLTANDWAWAGLIIYQPAGADVALNGDNSKLSTWKFNFKNCKYNGVKVTDVNFGEHNQVFYGYNMNKDGVVSDISGIVTATFK